MADPEDSERVREPYARRTGRGGDNQAAAGSGSVVAETGGATAGPKRWLRIGRAQGDATIDANAPAGLSLARYHRAAFYAEARPLSDGWSHWSAAAQQSFRRNCGDIEQNRPSAGTA